MTKAETILEKLLYPLFNHLMRLLAREYFTEFSRRESVLNYITIASSSKRILLHRVCQSIGWLVGWLVSQLFS